MTKVKVFEKYVSVPLGKIMVHGKKPNHKECKCGIWKPYLFLLGSYGEG